MTCGSRIENVKVNPPPVAHLCHHPSGPWGPSPGSPGRCPGSSGGRRLARCPPRHRPPRSPLRSQAGRSGPCHLARSLWPDGNKRIRSWTCVEREARCGTLWLHQRSTWSNHLDTRHLINDQKLHSWHARWSCSPAQTSSAKSRFISNTEIQTVLWHEALNTVWERDGISNRLLCIVTS